MPPLYITTQGAKLRYSQRRLIVEQDERLIAAVPVVHVDQVLIFGNISVTTPALSYLLESETDTVFLTLQGRYKGRLVGPSGGNGQLRLRQYARVLEPAYALETARAIVRAKLANTRTLLMRYARRIAEPELAGVGARALERARALGGAADQLDALLASLARAQSVNAISGHEGRGAAIYFGVFRHLIEGREWRFEGRNRRPPRDPVNALLSFGYTILTHNMEAAVRTVGLDPYLGFLHQVAYNRPSLALDLVEEFRPIVVDSVVLRCLNANLIRPQHFDEHGQPDYPVVMRDEGRAILIRELEARLALEFRHPETGERVTYRRCLELQVRQLARCLQGGEIYRPFTVR
jgi:CRISPR-associated protein Cas1